jgi:hypothetical protein
VSAFRAYGWSAAMVSVALTITARPASATIKVDEFLSYLAECERSRPTAGEAERCGFVNGYVSGTIDGILAAEKQGKAADYNPTVCRNIYDKTPAKLRDEFRRYLVNRKTEPDYHEERPVSRYFLEFFDTTYPCAGQVK